MAMSRCWTRGCDVGDDLRKLRLAVRTVAVGEHAHRHLIFADAVDAAGEMIFGAERDLQKAFDDLAVGEALLLGALALRDRGNSAVAGEAAMTSSATAARTARADTRRSAFGAHCNRRCRNRRAVRKASIAARQPCAAHGSVLRGASSSRSPSCRRRRGYRGPPTSSLVMRKQPEDTAWPIVSGSLEPWMR